MNGFLMDTMKGFKSPIHSKTGHILETKNMNVNFNT